MEEEEEEESSGLSPSDLHAAGETARKRAPFGGGRRADGCRPSPLTWAVWVELRGIEPRTSSMRTKMRGCSDGHQIGSDVHL